MTSDVIKIVVVHDPDLDIPPRIGLTEINPLALTLDTDAGHVTSLHDMAGRLISELNAIPEITFLVGIGFCGIVAAIAMASPALTTKPRALGLISHNRTIDCSADHMVHWGRWLQHMARRESGESGALHMPFPDPLHPLDRDALWQRHSRPVVYAGAQYGPWLEGAQLDTVAVSDSTDETLENVVSRLVSAH